MMRDAAIGALLQARALGRNFGGLRAVDDVSLSFERGQVHALLGPNGAGKSTLINLLSGELLPSAGTVLLDGVDVSRLPPHQRAARGIGRSFQKTNVFLGMSVLDNACLAAQAMSPARAGFFRAAASLDAVRGEAARALEMVGLAGAHGRQAAELSHGERRQLEMALVLAIRPAVLLLDEPLAGMGQDESGVIIRLIKRLAADHAVLLVEHDMDAVFAVADVVTVMTNGRVLMTGTPQSVRDDETVRQAYLGHTDDHTPR